MRKFRAGTFIFVCAISIAGLYYIEKLKGPMSKSDPYTLEIEKFRKSAEDRLRKSDGWLSVVGLSWLNPGANTIGSDAKNNIVLPPSAPASLGTLFYDEHHRDRTTIEFTNQDGVTLNGAPVQLHKRYDLKSDKTGDATQIHINSVTFFLIDRKNGVGVRVRDSDAEALKVFSGRKWFPIDTTFKVEAEWVAFEKPKPILMPDVLGNLNEELSPGYARFELNGEKLELHPTEEDGELFFVFRDQTSGKETYGAARFLNTKAPEHGRVTLDFNQAVNPPCAFTHFATCPMPPPENVMKVAVRAGELKQPGSDH